jgi:hypothetical protein
VQGDEQMHGVIIDIDILSVEMGYYGLVVYAQHANLADSDAIYDILMAVCPQISLEVGLVCDYLTDLLS